MLNTIRMQIARDDLTNHHSCSPNNNCKTTNKSLILHTTQQSTYLTRTIQQSTAPDHTRTRAAAGDGDCLTKRPKNNGWGKWRSSVERKTVNKDPDEKAMMTKTTINLLEGEGDVTMCHLIGSAMVLNKDAIMTR